MFAITRIPLIISLPVALAFAGCAGEGAVEMGGVAGLHNHHLHEAMPNNFPIKNESGKAATYSTAGRVDTDNAFFTPQGLNGRSCGSCHTPEDGWTISATTLQTRFEQTGGLDPVFNLLDADRPTAFANMDALRAATVDERRAAFSQLLQGKFIRRQAVAATWEFEVVDVSDPFGVSTPLALQFFRRSMPTANFRNHTVSWDSGNTSGTDMHAGLSRQARGNITGAQQGLAPANETVVQDIVNYEKQLSHAQISYGDLRLDEGGAKGGPENLSRQPLVAGRFDIYDAWIGHNNAVKGQIARGQELFNNGKDGRSCRGCHSAANDGQSATGGLFNIGASRPEFATPDMAIFTLRHKLTGELRRTTDGGRGWKTGLWNDLERFKTPSLRGVGSRGGYLHNGTAKTLMDVVVHYERALGFSFTAEERDDLVAFLNAL